MITDVVRTNCANSEARERAVRARGALGADSTHHARVFEHCESLLERSDLGLPALLALLERRADVVARRAQVRDVLDHLRQLLPIRRELHLRVAKTLVLLALLRLLRLLRLRRVLAELLVMREELLVGLRGGLLVLDELRARGGVAVHEVLEHLQRRAAGRVAARVRGERRLARVRDGAELHEAVGPAERGHGLVQRRDDVVVVALGLQEGLVLLLAQARRGVRLPRDADELRAEERDLAPELRDGRVQLSISAVRLS